MNQKYIKLITIIVFTLICFFFSFFQVTGGWDNLLLDLCYQTGNTPNTDIKIVAIDDKSLHELGKYETWNRSYYAKVIESLNQDENNKPLLIGMDVLFTGNSSEEHDQALVEACEKGNNVLVVSEVKYSTSVMDTTDINSIIQTSSLSMPYSQLSQVTDTAFANTYLDEDNNVRRSIFHIQRVDEDSFAAKMAKIYAEENGLQLPDYQSNQLYSFDYYAPPSTGYTILSFSDVYNGNIPGDLAGSVVLVGAYATGMMDDYVAPIAHSEKMNGVEIHANILNALIDGRIYEEAPVWLVTIISTLILFLVIFFTFDRKLLPIGLSALGAAILLFIIQFICRAVFSTVFPVVTPVLCLLVYFVSTIVFHYITEAMNKSKILATFKQYLSPDVIDSMAQSGDFTQHLSGDKRNIACLFIDVRGFTKMSEELTPEQVVTVLNKYLGMVTEQVFKNHGTLDKYIGDAVMAVYNAPMDLENYVTCAVQTGLDILEAGKKVQEEVRQLVNKDINYGIGINVGDAIIGNIGCDFRMDYTAIGDTVNTAARLESNAAGGQILISQAVYEYIKDQYECNYIGGMRFKNKAEDVICYEVIARK